MPLNIEKNFLHYVLTDTETLNEAILKGIIPEFFSNPHFEKIFKIASKYYQKYGNTLSDKVLLRVLDKSEIKSDKKKDAIVTFEELIEFQPEAPFEFLLDELVDQYKNRTLTTSLSEALDISESKGINEGIKVLKRSLVNLNRAGESEISGGKYRDSVDQRKRDYFERKKNPESIQGILSPFPTFNKLTNGLQEGEFCLVMSATSEGKSTFLLNLGHHAYRQGHNIIYIQIETSKESLEARTDALDSNISSRKLKLANLSEEEEEHYFKTLEKQRKRRGIFYICDIPSNCSTDVVAAQIENLKMQFSPDLVIVDYFDIMTPTYAESGGTGDNWKARKKMGVNLKSIAREYKVPIVTAAQVSGEGLRHDGESYQLQHVSLSKYLPAQTDITLSLKSADQEVTTETGLTELVCAFIKNRNNPKGQFTIYGSFDKFLLEEAEGIRKI